MKKEKVEESVRFRLNSGSLKGRMIEVPLQGKATRPTLGRVRQAMVNVLRPDLPGAVFLDLFAGTGLMGLHALSEGADVWWAEQDSTLVRALKHNLRSLGQDPSHVIASPYDRALYQLGKMGIVPDLVYLDPPFAMDPLPILMALPSVLGKQSRVFLECDQETLQIPENFRLHRSRHWGKIQVHEIRLCDTEH